MASSVRENIIEWTKMVKYFSIILNCTPGISHTEQLIVTLRFVDWIEFTVVVQEHFISFYEVDESTGEYIFVKIKQLLLNLKWNINDIRQG